MEIHIEKLSKEKLDEIINSGMEIFSKNTYIKASVNNIVDKTSISKGSFFNYFHDKFTFFCFLYDFAIKTLNEDFIDKIDISNSDFFERMKSVTLLKLQLSCKYPLLSEFLIKTYFEEDSKIREYILSYNKNYMKQNSDFIYKGIDTSKFKEGVSIEKVMEIITYVSEGIGKKYGTNPKLYSLMAKDFDETMDFLKPCFYKELVKWETLLK